jgi:hypothetical protein
LEITKEDVMAVDSPRQPRYVELLPPEKSTTPPPATQPSNQLPAAAEKSWMPPPLIQRVLDKMAKNDTRVFGDRVAEENRVIALLTEQSRLAQEFARQLGRARTIPVMAAAAEIHAYAEQEEIIARVLHDQKLAQLRREEELAAAQRRRDEAVRGPLPALPAPPKENRRKSRGERIKDARDECEEIVTFLRGGRIDDELDAATLQLILDCRYYANAKVKAIIEEDS